MTLSKPDLHARNPSPKESPFSEIRAYYCPRVKPRPGKKTNTVANSRFDWRKMTEWREITAKHRNSPRFDRPL